MKRLENYDCYAAPCGSVYYDESFNCRGFFTTESVNELSKSISEIGRLLSPVWLQPACDVPGGLPVGFDHRLIAGHRRFIAVTHFLKWTTIPAVIFSGLTERQARLMNFTENLERKDLNPVEEALAIGNMPWPNGMNVPRVAEELNKDHRWVHDRLRILKLPAEIQPLVAARRVTLLDLQLIFKKDTPAEQIKLANALAAARTGKGHNTRPVPGAERSFRRRRNKSEINTMIARLLNVGVSGIATRLLAWVAGSVSDAEIEADLQEIPKIS